MRIGSNAFLFDGKRYAVCTSMIDAPILSKAGRVVQSPLDAL